MKAERNKRKLEILSHCRMNIWTVPLLKLAGLPVVAVITKLVVGVKMSGVCGRVFNSKFN